MLSSVPFPYHLPYCCFEYCCTAYRFPYRLPCGCFTVHCGAKEKAAQDLSDAEAKRAALEKERHALRSEADSAQALAKTIARDKAMVENSQRMVSEEAKELDKRRTALEDIQDIGRRELDAGKAELKSAAEGLEREKNTLKAARKVRTSACF